MGDADIPEVMDSQDDCEADDCLQTQKMSQFSQLLNVSILKLAGSIGLSTELERCRTLCGFPMQISWIAPSKNELRSMPEKHS